MIMMIKSSPSNYKCEWFSNVTNFLFDVLER